MENIIKELQNELRTRFFMDGENHPKISAVKVYRFTDERIEMPQTDNPYLYIVLDGMLRLYTHQELWIIWPDSILYRKLIPPYPGQCLLFQSSRIFWQFLLSFFIVMSFRQF